jgi:lysophospholipase L1-like esterase
MMKISVLLIGFFLCVGVRAQVPATNLLVKNGQTVAFMGDSITDMGWGVSGGFVHLVVEGLAANGVTITPIPAGVGGNRSTEMLKRVDADVIAKKPDWTLLSCGVNDVWSRTIDLDTFKKQITEIVDKLQAAGIQVMLLTPTPIYEASKQGFNDKLPDYVAFMKQLAQERHLPCADVHAAWLDYLAAHADPANHNIVTLDGVHPNPDGHQLFAKTILAAFGATPEQIATADKAWRAAPVDATVLSNFGFNSPVPLTADELAALNKLAADEKVQLNRIIHTASLQTERELLQTENLSKMNPWDMNKKFGAGVKAKLDALTGTPPNAPGATTPQSAGAGFRVGVPVPISEWEALKKAAAARKVTPSQLISQSYMETVGGLLAGRGNLSTVWSDDISRESTAPFKTKLDAVATKDGGWTAPTANP